MMEWILLLIVIGFLVTRLLPPKGVINMTAEEAKQKLTQPHVQWIDVRTPGEYRAYHHKPFKNIPLFELPQKVNQLKKDQEVVLICQSGMRSLKAAKILKKQGFEKVINVKGGMNAWL